MTALVQAGLTVLLSAAAAPVILAWSYLAYLSLAALAYRQRAPAQIKALPRLTVLVPAHNEAELIARCVRSMVEQTYPAALRRVVVVADNCSDATAELAARAGAEVMVRNDVQPAGKGRALRWAMDSLIAAPDAPDGFVIVDADSVAEPGLLLALANAMDQGALIAQADYTVLEDAEAGSGDRLRALAVLLYNRARNRGRAVTGLPATLLGNGMLLSRQLVASRPWTAFSPAEDLEFGTRCRIDGIQPRFVDAGVQGPLPIGYAAGAVQRVRWEGGRFYVVRRLGAALLSRLVRHPDRQTIDAVLELVVPPIAILTMLNATGLGLSLIGLLLGVAGVVPLLLWVTAALLGAVHVALGLKAAGAPWRSTRILVVALPGFLVWKIGVYLRLVRGFDPNQWHRSMRKGEST